MTVLLVGVGGDGDNLDPAPHYDEYGRYEYIPIPETWPTAEDLTYGTYELRHSTGTATDLVDRIRPGGSKGDWIQDPTAIANHPVHNDPHFKQLTFGDRRGGGGKGSQLVKHLQGQDDAILGFYNGIRDETGHLNRYLYGYFKVDEVHDLSVYSGGEYIDRLLEFPENAHSKRVQASGEPKHDDVVIVDGKEPAALLDKPIQVGERIDERPWYRVTERFASEFEVVGGRKGIGRKFPLVLDLTTAEFFDKIHTR